MRIKHAPKQQLVKVGGFIRGKVYQCADTGQAYLGASSTESTNVGVVNLETGIYTSYALLTAMFKAVEIDGEFVVTP